MMASLDPTTTAEFTDAKISVNAQNNIEVITDVALDVTFYFMPIYGSE
jgi:hypothetical protein